MKPGFIMPTSLITLVSLILLAGTPGASTGPVRLPVSGRGAVEYIDAVTGMGFTLVTGGTFYMGDVLGVGRDNERPVHLQAVSDFYLARHEVTVDQFRRFVEDTGYRTEAERAGQAWDWDGTTMRIRAGLSWRRPNMVQTGSHPVVFVSWNDATVFANWLAARTGIPYRLPSEAEWEYAARSGGRQERWAGVSDPQALSDFVWFVGNSAGGTRPVGGKKANGLGIFDMSGNVWEWCGDVFQGYRRETGKGSPEPPGGRFRVLRGGSWKDVDDYSRTTYRNGYRADFSFKSIGFRLAFSRQPEG